MCTPAIIAGIGLAISVGAEAVNYASQNARSNANERAAKAAQAMEMQQIGLRQQQVQEAGAQTIMGADRQAREAEAMARVSAGESNISGISVDALLGNLERQRLDYDQSVRRNEANQLDQLQAAKAGADAQADSRIASIPGGNPFALGLQIGGSAIGAYRSYLDMPKAPETKPIQI